MTAPFFDPRDQLRGLLGPDDLAIIARQRDLRQAVLQGEDLSPSSQPAQVAGVPPQPPQPMPQQGPGVAGGILGTLFGGPASGLLGEEAQGRAGLQALIAAGGAIAQAGQPEFGVARRTTGSAIAAGLTAGRESFARSVEEGLFAQEQQREATLRERLETADTSREELLALAPSVIAGGDPNQIQGFMQLLNDQGATLPPELERFEGVDEEGNPAFFVMDAFGNVSQLTGAFPNVGSTGTDVERFVAFNEESGRNEVAVFDPTTELIRFTGVQPKLEDQRTDITEAEKKLGSLYQAAQPADLIIRSLTNDPTIADALLRPLPAIVTPLLSETQQKLDLAAEAFAQLWIRPISGAAVPPSEIESTRKIFIPIFGDKESVLRIKADNRARLLRFTQRRLAGTLTRADLLDTAFRDPEGGRVAARDITTTEEDRLAAGVVVDATLFDVESF